LGSIEFYSTVNNKCILIPTHRWHLPNHRAAYHIYEYGSVHLIDRSPISDAVDVGVGVGMREGTGSSDVNTTMIITIIQKLSQFPRDLNNNKDDDGKAATATVNCHHPAAPATSPTTDESGKRNGYVGYMVDIGRYATIEELIIDTPSVASSNGTGSGTHGSGDALHGLHYHFYPVIIMMALIIFINSIVSPFHHHLLQHLCHP
jgi:hypothetical protein